MNILLTGPPGCGKTTVIIKLADRLAGRPVSGFYTQELREGGSRVGFGIRTFDGVEGVLAHVKLPGPKHVGRYGVDVAGFESIALPTLARTDAKLLVIDEIGKMECFSQAFCDAVWAALDSGRDVIATIAMKGGGFIERIKSRPDVVLLKLTVAERDVMPARLAEMVGCA